MDEMDAENCKDAVTETEEGFTKTNSSKIKMCHSLQELLINVL